MLPLILTNATLIAAFSSVFNVHDTIADAAVLGAALQELDKMGIDPAKPWTALSDEQVALVLMKASLAEYLIGLQDPKDWAIVMVESGHLVRERSFSAVHLAVIESLLIIAVVALGWAVWNAKKTTS
jgi:hypothetical protein